MVLYSYHCSSGDMLRCPASSSCSALLCSMSALCLNRRFTAAPGLSQKLAEDRTDNNFSSPSTPSLCGWPSWFLRLITEQSQLRLYTFLPSNNSVRWLLVFFFTRSPSIHNSQEIVLPWRWLIQIIFPMQSDDSCKSWLCVLGTGQE